MMPLLLVSCIVTTNILELQSYDYQRACGEGIQSISINGNHERLTYSVQYDKDWKDKHIDSNAHRAAAYLAQQSCEILNRLYSIETCIYEIRDRNNLAVCTSKINPDGSGSSACADVVGEKMLSHIEHLGRKI